MVWVTRNDRWFDILLVLILNFSFSLKRSLFAQCWEWREEKDLCIFQYWREVKCQQLTSKLNTFLTTIAIMSETRPHTPPNRVAQSQWARAVEYTDYFSAENHSDKCPGYDTKQSDDEVPVMLELWGMRSSDSLQSFPDLPWPEVIAPDRVLSMSQIELNCVLMLNWNVWSRTVLYAKLNCLKEDCFWHWTCVLRKNWIVWNRTVLTFNCE